MDQNERTINCPNCGAPISDNICPYCGSVIYDFADIEVGKLCFLRVKAKGVVMTLQAKLEDMHYWEKSDNDNVLYFDNVPYAIMGGVVDRGLDLHFTVVPEENGIVGTIYKKPKEE